LALLLGDVLTIAVVLGLLIAHANRHDYAIESDARLVWTLVYIGMLLLANYAVGLPGETGRRGPVVSAVLAAGAAAIGIWVCRLVAGSALLPRFVVFVSATLVSGVWATIGLLITRHETDSTRVSRVVFVGTAGD